jgi:hypothetical protein
MILLSLLMGCGLLLITCSLIGGGFSREYRWAPAGVGMLLLMQTGILSIRQPRSTSPPPTTEQAAIRSLHDPKAQDWLNASPAVRQATAIQWLKDLRLRGTFVLTIRSETEYTQWAAALNRCLEHKAEKLSAQTELLSFVETQCLPKLKHYRYGKNP